MAPRAPAVFGWLVFSVLVFISGPAFSWVETAVKSHEARVEVAEDGTALVRHQLVLKVRGGPMKSLELSGITGTVTPLPDANVRVAVEGSHSQWPLKVALQEDGSFHLRILAERGLRGGSYLFSFAYSLDLEEQGFVQAVSDGYELTWVGPRLSTGVDSAKVVFVVPRAESPPKLADTTGVASGVLLGEVRRGASTDEIDLIRAHLAEREPAVWKVVVPSESLRALKKRKEQGQPALTPLSQKARVLSSNASQRTRIFLSSALGLIYALLVFFKFHQTRNLGKKWDVRVKPLLPGPPWLRAPLAGGLVLSATFFAIRLEPYTAVILGALAACFATHLLPVRITRPRGPGHWEQVSEQLRESTRGMRSGWFEVRSLRGFLLFFLLSFTLLALAYRVLPSSSYLALMICAGFTLLVPLFWTGRLADFPEAPISQARPWFSFLTRAMDPGVAEIQLWGRRAIDGDRAVLVERKYDETRLRVVLKQPPVGLRALEISMDEGPGATVLPCVIVRVLVDSAAHTALPTDIPWTRGRTSEERVAILRPACPTRAQLLRLVRTLQTHLRGAASRSMSTSSRSRGSAEAASKSPVIAPVPLM